MSCYNWESGTITIPTSEWSNFRKGLLTKWNEGLLKSFEDAKAAHAACTAAAKGKRGENRQKAIEDALVAHCTERVQSSYYGYGSRTEVNYDRKDRISNLILKREGWNGPFTLTAPKKSDLKLLAVSKDANIRSRDFSVHFRNETRTVTWDVSENNRAVESAHEHWFAKALFEALGKVTWTRGTGGTIVGNDEYNRDCDYAGGGSNYVAYEFSKEKQERDRKDRARYGSYGGYGRSRW